MSENPTQAQLPWLVMDGLALVERRLSGGGVGSGLYDSVHAQLLWVQEALASEQPPDPEKLDSLLLGVYAAREFETSDPELADILFNVQYLVNRHWPPPESPPGPDLRPLFAKRLKSIPRRHALLATVCLVTGGLMGALAFAAHPTIAGRIVLLAVAAAALVAVAWLGWLVINSGPRHRRLLEALDTQPDRIARIYLTAATLRGDQARWQNIEPSQVETMPSRTRISIVLELADPTTRERRLGVDRETVPVEREEAVPLLAWLREKVPAASGRNHIG